MYDNIFTRHEDELRAVEAAWLRKFPRSRGRPVPREQFSPPHVPAQRQLVEQVIEWAVHARHRHYMLELDRCYALLAAGPGGETGIQVVNRALFAWMLREVEGAWRRGWQPAELVRVARREYNARQGRLMVDAVAAQMRGYAKATVGQRWQSQLAALDARVWWDHDDHYVTAWGEREGLARVGAIAYTVTGLQIFRTLPEIVSVGPMPGTASPDGTAPLADLDQRLLHRVRALLAKAESTDFPEEADAFTAKAQELMARHRIDHAMLAAASGGRDRPVNRRVSIDNPYEEPKSLLLHVVAKANSCQAVWTKRFGFTTIVGFPSDLESTELLFTSLLVQATRAMTRADTTTRSFRQSFLTAYASRIGERLNTAAGDVDREMTESVGAAQLLPVLAARDDAVREVFEKQFPEVTYSAPAVKNWDGWAQGRAAADQASLHGRRAVDRT